MTSARVLRASLLVLVATTMLLGQGDTGGIGGTVLDPSGAVIPGAAITVTKADTGVSYPTVSTESGGYSVRGLRAGVYTVEVEQPGFKKLVQDNVVVTIGSVTPPDLTLVVGATTETVEVVTALPTLKKETTDVSTSIDPTTWLDLPLNASGGRKPFNFIVLSPGVSGLGGETFDHTINGGQILGTQVLIDGMDAGGALGTPGDVNKALRLPPEVFQEFTLNTSNYSAEFSNTTGGYYSFTVRSGTNELHGNLFEFLRNDKLDSKNWFAAERGINRQNEYGGSVGGPVWLGDAYDGRNKSFWFFALHRFVIKRAPSSGLISVPTAPFKNGNFAGLVNAFGDQISIYDPATTRDDGTGGFTRDRFPGNTIPDGRISPVGANILSFYPAPTRAGETNNFLEKQINDQTIDSVTIKVDHRFNQQYSIHWSGSRSQGTVKSCFNPCFDPEGETGATNKITSLLPASFMRASFDIMASPTVLINFAGGVTRHLVLTTFTSFGANRSQRLGIGNIVGNGPFPSQNIPPYVSMGAGGTGTNEFFIGTQTNALQSISIVRGKHSFKIGAEQRGIRTDHDLPSNSGRFRWNQAETAFPSQAGTTGYALASVLLGYVDSADQHVQEFTGASRFGYYGAYVQDDYKMLPNLTWNIGLRWEVYLPMYGVHDNYSIMDPARPNPGAGGLPGAIIFAGFGEGREGRRRLTPPFSWNNWGPRLGVAWEARPGTVIRSAYGLNYVGPLSAGTGSIRGYHPGFSSDPFFQTPNAGIDPAFIIDDGFPQFDRPPFIDPAFGIGSSTALWDSNASEPAYIQQFHFTIQQELAQDWMFETAYVGSKGTRLNSGVTNLNQVHPNFLSLEGLLFGNITDPAVAAAGFRPPYPAFVEDFGLRASLAQALRPFPQYNHVAGGANLPVIPFLGGVQTGNSTYHSFQMKLKKQLSRGFFLLTSYTWAKHLGDSNSSMGGFFGSGARDHYNRQLEKSLSPTHTPQRLTIAFSYKLPFGPGKPFGADTSGALAKLIGGWQVNGIMDYMAGRPMGAFINNGLPLFNELVQNGRVGGSNATMPNVVSGVPQKLHSGGAFDPQIDFVTGDGERYLNIDAFADPGFAIGNGPATLPQVRGFNFLSENFGLVKRTPITERINLEFRFELFNAFNRHSFGRSTDSNISHPTFGAIFGTALSGREGQFGLKINF